ncbi:hypothetical protein J6590_036377 [Homalodisca vitripennis]|nr:hypothetical protein J6590_036377 [Homalodisca vitripennis]
MSLVGLCNVAKSCRYSEERKTPGGPMDLLSFCGLAMLPNRAETVRSERPPAVLWVIRVPGVLNTTGLLGPWCADTMGLVDCAMLPNRADTVRSERPRRAGSSEFLVC